MPALHDDLGGEVSLALLTIDGKKHLLSNGEVGLKPFNAVKCLAPSILMPNEIHEESK